MSRTRQQGFTLIEAAVAIAVVAILSGIIVPLVVKNLNDARNARAQNDVQVIAAAVASQLKDTGRRPMNAGGPGGATGQNGNTWASGPATAVGYPTNTAPVGGNANTFTNLFTNGGAVATTQTLFYGAGSGVTVANEFAYKGPYLGIDVAGKLDPWGYRYLILGYNANGQNNNLPIYIVSAGPDGTILNDAAHWNGGAGPAGGNWTKVAGNASADDIVTRVN